MARPGDRHDRSSLRSQIVISKVELGAGELKKEIGGGPIEVSLDRLNQRTRFHLIRLRERSIENDVVPANQQDGVFYAHFSSVLPAERAMS